jgi:hypothetical protein
MIGFLIGDEIWQIIDDNSTEAGPSSNWILVAALKVYVSNIEFLNMLCVVVCDNNLE